MRKPTTHGMSEIVRDGERLALLRASIPVPAGSAEAEARALAYAEALLSGAGPYSRHGLLDALGFLGASVRVGAGDGLISISVDTVDTSLQKTLTLLSHIVTRPHFSSSELTRIKKHVANALELSLEDARGRAYEGFVNAFLEPTDRRYVQPLADVMKALARVTPKDLRRLHDAVRASAWNVVLGGSEESVRRMRRSLSALSIATVSSSHPHTGRTVRGGRTLALVDIPHKQNIEFSIGGPLSLRPTERAYAAFVFGMSVLGIHGGFTGRLMSIVREKEGLTYSIYANVEKATTSEDGFWRIATFFNPKDAERGIRSTLREIERIRTDGITEDELRRFKSILATRFALRDDSLVRRVGETLGRMNAGLTEAEHAAQREALLSLSVDEVNDAMRTHLSRSFIVIGGAGPVAKVEPLLRKLV
ncbi:MAG TPA: insulinase family protein [Candidatus Paceibacterota bacterium]|nr:insulinase family protein [Candidatus Paceibacterota bacterium]